jgi:hypothetical protein
MKLLFFIILIFYSFQINAEVQSCVQFTSEANTYIEKMKNQMKAGLDIDQNWGLFEKLNNQFPNCVTNNEDIEKFKKYMTTPDMSFNLDANDCSEYKIDTSNMPHNNNQADLQWCFAFSSSDLISFKEKTRLSAYDIAINYHNNRSYDLKISDFTLRPGRPVEALELTIMKENGICLEDEVNYTNGDWAKMSHMIQSLNSPEKKLSEIFCQNKINDPETHINCLKNLDVLDLLPVEKRAAAFLDIQCQNRFKLKNKYTAHLMGTNDTVTPEKILEKTDYLLSIGEPLTMVYSAEMLSSGVNFKGTPNHASTVIGRKFNQSTGQCEYLIRNTWGTSSCENKSTKSIRCENGNYWVPRTTLKNNTNYISWLSDGPNK